jgi:hypothetical protein
MGRVGKEMRTMYTIQDIEKYLEKHHPQAMMLRPIKWLIFGHINYERRFARTSRWDMKLRCWVENKWIRKRKFKKVMMRVAKTYGVPMKDLIYFVNHEYLSTADWHHVHFLLFIDADADGVCHLLHQITGADKVFGRCRFYPFNDQRDGIGYVTKRVFKNNGEEREPDMYMSPSLKSLVQKNELELQPYVL